MGEFFDNVVIFMEEYYVYVIGVGLIIILMLIGFLASRRKAKKASNQNDTMVNINDVNTGSINDVASTLQSANTAPVTVAPAVPTSDAVISNDGTEVLETEPVVNPMDSFNNTPVQNVEPTDINTASPFVEEVKPSAENSFDRPEIIDFSALSKPEPMAEISPMVNAGDFSNPTNTIEPVNIGTVDPATDIIPDEPTPIQSVNVMPANEAVTEEVEPVVESEPVTDINANNYNPFVVDKSQYDDILNGETSSTNESNMQ